MSTAVIGLSVVVFVSVLFVLAFFFPTRWRRFRLFLFGLFKAHFTVTVMGGVALYFSLVVGLKGEGQPGVATVVYSIIWSLLIGAFALRLKVEYGNVVTKKLQEFASDYEQDVLSAATGLVNIGMFRRLEKGGELLRKLLDMEEPRNLRPVLIKDYVESLERQRYLLSAPGYLDWLARLARDHRELVCINRVPPVHWFSPRSLTEADFISEYAEIIEERMQEAKMLVKRITLVKDKELLEQQVENILKDSGDDSVRLRWFLFLLLRLQSETSVGGGLERDSASLESAIGKLPLIQNWLRNTLLKDFLQEIEYLESSQRKQHESLLEELRGLTEDNSAIAREVSRLVLLAFYNKMGKEGSFWMTEERFVHMVGGRLNEEEGLVSSAEIGLFRGSADRQDLSFLAVSGSWSSILIKSQDASLTGVALEACFDRIAAVGSNAEHGSIKDFL